MERWVLLRKGADFEAISKKFHISPRLASLIRNRDVIGDEAINQYLNGTIAELYDGMQMKGMPQAVEILTEKIRDREKIRVIGDYDCDGINATYILLEGLEKLGAKVDSDIPDRIKDGYGLNQHLIDRAHEDGIDTIITCDNGIAAAKEIEYGKALGMTIIVTDHHEVPYKENEAGRRYILPPADAVVDPRQEGCEYPFKGLCGAAVAYKLVEALCEANGQDVADLDYLLENVAIATVADVMDLTEENRILVKQGLEMLKRTSNLGLRALIQCIGLEGKKIQAYHIGFILAPCLNASGKLDTAKRALALLRAKTEREADMLAGDLKALNESRRDMTDRVVDEAMAKVERTDIRGDKVLVIYLPDCHESLAGLVAGRVRENYYRPVFVLTDSEDGVKGSGRSIESYSMYEELTGCGDLLTKFGGHPMAAGLSLDKENVEKFKRRLNDQCTLSEEELTEKVVIDMELPFAAITEHFIEELEYMEPFGKGNTKPVFAARGVAMQHVKIIGKNKNVAKATAIDAAGNRMEAICFHDAQEFAKQCERNNGKMSITFYPGINEFRGERQIQIVITHYR
ncbi:single-stranded-DNA-specific exonuclease RecJ [Dorea formicigenerans]|uniref:Single-stranded-DNA-specific exonuclease RecJ n=1 Tax=Dorea formicigenerans TaxID=39486 RepID=A0A413SPI9_9FIRM|nr:single-stranded-DNA-specific exonuclease RecJ [Dorea formicigenerans]NSE46557.1 single-stranded-DNA-specific exonuclease RecJ [Dorea formicigenerans]RGJ66298.1 single-stranded-DNA-specific exonuclease RecJ [Dorea formicigenerans]RHA69865.1 single-stranded-DNA-specific exonuclease RecJ [Dorea formicigenerans]RHF79543.1 single-stranded-DNA-specific exonuclease RecJ [Dorea formicigenerans]